MLKRILPWLVAVAAIPVAFVAGSQLAPRETKVDRPVTVRPTAAWSPSQLENVFSRMTPVEVQQFEEGTCSLYGSSATPATWAAQVCVQSQLAGPAG